MTSKGSEQRFRISWITFIVSISTLILVGCGAGEEARPDFNPIPLPTVPVTASPPPAVVATSQPVVPGSSAWDDGFQPGDPTATPPGERIADPNFQAGRRAYLEGNDTEVLRLMDLALDSDPGLAPAYWYRAMAYLRQGDLRNAQRQLDRALQLDPNYALAYAERGALRHQNGDVEGALADYLKALSIDPSLASAHQNVGRYYLASGDLEQARAAFDLAVRIDAGRGDSWTSLASVLLRAGEYQGCVTITAQALEILPEFWPLFGQQAACYVQMGEYDLAVASFEPYLAAVTNDKQAYYQRGLALRALGQNQLALEDLTRALELDPAFIDVRILRAEMSLEQGRYDLALEDYDTILTHGQNASAILGRGDALRGLGRLGEAEAAYLKTLLLFSDNTESYLRLVDLYLQQGEAQKALDSANQALSGNPTPEQRTVLLVARGQAYYALGNYTQAIVDLEQALASGPPLKAYYYLGIAYQDSGQAEQAIQYLDHFLTYGGAQMPDLGPDAQARLSQLQG